MAETERPIPFEQVLNEEIDHIAAARRAAAGDSPYEVGGDSGQDVLARAHGANLFGLALSGGGIRSATFCLGVLQSLTRHRLLGRIDYLSTVSGGGYIGSWLTAWIHRHREGVLGVQREMRDALAGHTPEPREIGWLRDYSNYLTVRLGFFSGDSWATIAIYLRNLWLNLVLIVACLGVALMLPRVLVLAVGAVPTAMFSDAGVALLAFVILWISANMNPPKGDRAWFRTHGGVVVLVLAPGFVAAVLLAHALVADFPGAARVRDWLGAALYATPLPRHLTSWIIAGAVLYSAPWLVGAFLALLRPQGGRSTRFRWGWVVLFAPFAGALLGALSYGYQRIALHVLRNQPLAADWLITGFGAPALLGIFSLALVLHIGLVSRGFAEDVREWWGRLGGWATLGLLVWTLGFAIVLFAPALIAWAGDWAAALGLGWIGSTLAGVLLGKSAATGTGNVRRARELLVVVLPFVFVTGMVVAIAFGVHHLLAPAAPTASAAWGAQAGQPTEQAPKALGGPGAAAVGAQQAGTSSAAQAVPADQPPPRPRLREYVDQTLYELALAQTDAIWWWLLGLVVLAFLLQLRVDVNVFSLGPLYRNRLLRCYLGASRQSERNAHPFTGFDRDDDLRLMDLVGARVGDSACVPQRPYPLINTAINLTTGQKLAWQHRKAASFLFSPLYCGYQMPDEQGSGWRGRFAATGDYVSGPANPRRRGWIALSNAVTISGAAASPNAGYHSSPTVAFLLTVFNVRLGSWFQNPRWPGMWRRPGPLHALKPLLSELFGLSNDRSDYVYLSDGGHFENLGIYELVRRRCRFIIACDASCDTNSGFDDLGNAIRKCRIDLDVDIEIDTSALQPCGDDRLSTHHCALGLIRYDRVDARESVGYLLYVKASMTGDEPQDVKQYRTEHPSFPHQSTADQFFDEPQFESYRRLGLHVMDTLLQAPIAQARPAAMRVSSPVQEARVDAGLDIDLDRLFKELAQRWYPPSGAPEGAAARHGATLQTIFERIRTDDRLRFLDRQFYPEWPHLEAAVGARSREHPWLPTDVHQLRAAFYLCNSIIQLMEDVYNDLDLEIEYDHPDHRGWMNLFRHWSWSGMLRVTWAVSGSGYGARFQSFCERHLGLGESRVVLADEWPVAACAQAPAEVALNPVEQRITDALLAAGEIEGGDVIVRFNLTVRSALSAPGKNESFGFPIAFGVLHPSADGFAHGQLRYFRVADHLQRMGLGWRSMLALLERYPQLELGLATRSPLLRTIDAESDRARFVRLFDAARRVAEANKR